jgi:hypothetical protein
MFWKSVFSIIPVPFFVTDNMPKDFGAQAKLFFCKIRPEYVNDEGLIQHELTHIRWSYLCLHIPYAILYKFTRWFRLKAEISGYRTQIKCGGDKYVMAYRLANFYDLNISQDEVENIL